MEISIYSIVLVTSALGFVVLGMAKAWHKPWPMWKKIANSGRMTSIYG